MAKTALGFHDGIGLSIAVAGVEYGAHIKGARFENLDEDPKFQTFKSAGAGDGRWVFRGTAFQSHLAASFWKYVWENAGGEAVVTLAPYGNEDPSVTEPHYEASATIKKKPNIGGDVNTEFEFEVEWDLTDPPVEITTTTP